MGEFGSPIYFSYIYAMKDKNIQPVEQNVLIARRIPPGDKYRLVANEPEGQIHKTLTDTLEAYSKLTGFKGAYRLEPLKNELYAIFTEEVPIQPIKKVEYSIYEQH